MNRAGEDCGLLGDDGDHGAEGWSVEAADVDSTEGDGRDVVF